MGNDAFSAGVLHGGVFGTADLKILICYILSTIEEPVPANKLVNLFHVEGIANGFEVSDALVSLEKNGQIKQVSEKEDAYVITPGGRDIARELSVTLSRTVRNRAYDATLKMMTLYKNARDTRFEITRENGKCYLSCSAIDGDAPFLTVKLLLPDEGQAEYIKEKFLSDPSGIFSKVIEMLTK